MPLWERQEIQEMLRCLSVWESWLASVTLTAPALPHILPFQANSI
jgi:hypothetical protein